MNWLEAATALLVSFGITLIAVGLSIRLSMRWKVLDHPDGGRKTQSSPVPKLGGIAVAVVMTLIVSVGFVATGRLGLGLALQVLVPALAAAAIGFLDDRNDLNPYVRLLFVAVVGALAWLLGSRIELTGVAALDTAMTVLWVVVLVNAVNLLDNADGLAASTVFVMAAAASTIAALFGQALVSLLGVTLMGVAIGYLRHNWHPARVYMGDSGAYFLGTLMALLLIRLAPTAVPPGIAAAAVLLIALLPLLDMTFVVVRRVRSGIHPFTAGRDHLSHELQRRGFSVPVSVSILQVISLIGAISAVVIVLPWVPML